MCRVTKAATGRLSFGYFSLAEHKFAWSEFEQPIRLARRAKTREGFRNEKYLAVGCENPIQASVAAATL